jgi:hypothetical protein
MERERKSAPTWKMREVEDNGDGSSFSHTKMNYLVEEGSDGADLNRWTRLCARLPDINLQNKQSANNFLPYFEYVQFVWLRAGWARSSRQGQEIFLYPTASRLRLGPSQTPNEWVPGTLSPTVKRPGHESDLLLQPRSRMGELYLHSPICLHGMMLFFCLSVAVLSP